MSADGDLIGDSQGRPVDFGAVALGDAGGPETSGGGLTYDQLHQVSGRGGRGGWLIGGVGAERSGDEEWDGGITSFLCLSPLSHSTEPLCCPEPLKLPQTIEGLLADKGYSPGSAISEQELLEQLPPPSFNGTIPR